MIANKFMYTSLGEKTRARRRDSLVETPSRRKNSTRFPGGGKEEITPNFQGRSPKHQASNERACEIIAYAIMALIVLGALGWLGGRAPGSKSGPAHAPEEEWRG